ncbi:MAG: (Fe-S)-binding protein [Deltaproteobacteria bacterium]|nr:(Fe-S)-binding protein [Deltaproteobacteria bacterium]
MEQAYERCVYLEQLGLFGCVQCGKCTAGCPINYVTTHEEPFNIRRLVYDVQYAKDEEIADERHFLWQCTTCSTCSLRCPKEIEPRDVVINLRSILVENGTLPPAIRDVLKSISINYNPWSLGKDKRAEWYKDLETKDAGESELCFYVGCTPAFDNRLQKVAQANVRVMQKLGVDFGIFGTEEICCGNEIKRLGDIWSFEALRDANTEVFNGYENIKKIFSISPHCFNTFTHEYPDLKPEVEHYTQLFAGLIKDGKLVPEKEFTKKVAYHDPCFLGKQNDIYEEPRDILKSVPGLELIEFDRNRESSLCCEGGGGRMWIEIEDAPDRLANIRVRDAAEMGVEVIAVACPFCLLTLEDAVKAMELEDKLQVMDIMEIVDKTL